MKITGIDALQKKLRKNATLDDVKHVVKSNGAQLTTRIQKYAVFRGHYEGKKFVKRSGRTSAKKNFAKPFMIIRKENAVSAKPVNKYKVI